MLDTEVLINLVRERPCLYDYRHKDYKRTDIKQNNWEEIATAMGLSNDKTNGR